MNFLQEAGSAKRPSGRGHWNLASEEPESWSSSASGSSGLFRCGCDCCCWFAFLLACCWAWLDCDWAAAAALAAERCCEPDLSAWLLLEERLTPEAGAGACGWLVPVGDAADDWARLFCCCKLGSPG